MKSKKIAIIGANGQLGTDIQKIFSTETNYTVFPLTHNDIEITDPQSIAKTLDNIDFDILINTAAYNNVDEIERKMQKAFLVNGIACKYLAEYSNYKKAIFITLSTDYVFGADQKKNTPYKEEDCPGPVNTYGISKLAGEYFIKFCTEKYFIIRTCGLFGLSYSSGKKTNFIESILKKAKEKKEISVVNDQIISPTYTRDLAKQIQYLIKTNAYGLYHATAESQCSWYEFAKTIFHLTKTTDLIRPIPSSLYQSGAKRPSYSVLENQKLKKLGIHTMRNWKEGLYDYLQEKGYL